MKDLALYNIHYLKQLEDRYYSLLHQSVIKLIDWYVTYYM